MRPVNLIPADQRRGGPRLAGARLTVGGIAVYGVLGVMALAVVAVATLVVTNNHVNEKKSTVAKLEKEQTTAQAAADALRPYGNFAQIQRARVDTINALADSAFNWERVLRQISRTIPSDVWLTSMTATVSPDIDLGSSGGGGSGLRAKAPSPAVSLTGCTYSHKAVARLMSRMRNIDDVTEVALSDSEKPTGKGQAENNSGNAAGSGGGGSASTDCRTKYTITKFDIVVVIGDAPPTTPAVPAQPQGSTSPVASAQAAVATSQQASAAAGGGP